MTVAAERQTASFRGGMAKLTQPHSDIYSGYYSKNQRFNLLETDNIPTGYGIHKKFTTIISTRY